MRLRPAGEKVVEKIVEKIVYKEKPASDYDRNVSEHESIEENFEIIGRVKVEESEAVYEKLTKEEEPK